MGSCWLLMVNAASILMIFLLVVLTEAAKQANIPNYTVEQKIRDDSDLSQFYSLLESSQVANTTLNHRQVTLFAPINMAFKSDIKDKQTYALYHMTNLGLTLDQLPASVNSEMDGSPPLWITRRKLPGQYKEDIYVNNARIIQDRSDYQKMNNHKKQVLHIIDGVLEPVTTNPEIPGAAQVYNPDALQFLNQSENLIVGHRVRSFRQRVNLMNKGDIFKAEGKHTFFIPVDEGFVPPPRPEKIDQKVIDGHVIPGEVLFTAATDPDKDYNTLAFSDMVRVTISFTHQSDGKYYVKSNTVVGDPTHATGVVLAEIIKANIPVKNGVVHLIQRPLMVVDNDVKQFLEENVDGPLHKFYQVILDVGDDFLKKITKMDELTLFAPSNEAWSDNSAIDNLLPNREKMREILNLHLVERRLPMDTIIEKNINEVPTVADRKSLYFNIIHGTGNNFTLTVEGGGVNATVIQPNIAATNGIIHIIDRVLGVPFTTVRDKLATDPMLNKTFFLGKQHDFNKELTSMKKKFTYFVPRDLAWRHLEINDPSTYKKLFMNEFGYHVRQILERHLVVSDRVYTMADLKVIANETITLPTYRDHLRLRVRESGKSYSIEWQGEWIHVFRPDVECTNGIIHVIDKVFLKDSDIRVTGGVSVPFLAPHLAMLLMAKWLLL